MPTTGPDPGHHQRPSEGLTLEGRVLWPGRKGESMAALNRREFLQAGTTVLGTAVLADAVGQWSAPAVAADGAEYEIYAAKYGGPLVRRLAIVLWNVGWEETGPLSYFVWALKAKTGEAIVIDTGASPAQGVARKIPDYVSPIQVLDRAGITGDNVTKVIITHMHWDHVGGMETFLTAYPKAKFYVQKREFDFCVNNPVSGRKPVAILFDPDASKIVGGLEKSERLAIVDGDAAIASGVDVLLAPGHTVGLQVVRVQTAKGPAIVGSDCAHVFRGYQEDNPSVFIMDLPAWMQSFDKVKAQAPIGRIFPGHDVLMAEGYPKVADGVTRLV